MILLPLTACFLAISLGAYGQGKIGFGNDSAHLVILRPGIGYPGPPPYGLNEPIAGTLDNGITLVAGLFAGTSSTSMTLQSGTTLLTGTGLSAPGIMAIRPIVLNGIPGGVPQFFQVVIWNSALPEPGPTPFLTYWGFSPIFQATPGTSISYPSIMPGSPANSTLAPGELRVDVNGPEPSALALFSLGFAIYLHIHRQHSFRNAPRL